VVAVMAVVVALEVVVVVMMAVMEVDEVVGVVVEDVVVVSEIEVVVVEDSVEVGVVVGANVVGTEVVVVAVMVVATEVVDMEVDMEVVSKENTVAVATEDKATTLVDTAHQLCQQNQHTIRTEVQVARTQPEVVVATVHNRKPRQPEVTLKEAATQDRPTPRTTGSRITEVDKVTANRVALRVETKVATQVRPTGRVTAAHHNNPQHQHLQVTHKVTTNSNNNNPHTEVQVEVVRTDINSKLDVVTFSHEETIDERI